MFFLIGYDPIETTFGRIGRTEKVSCALYQISSNGEPYFAAATLLLFHLGGSFDLNYVFRKPCQSQFSSSRSLFWLVILALATQKHICYYCEFLKRFSLKSLDCSAPESFLHNNIILMLYLNGLIVRKNEITEERRTCFYKGPYRRAGA